MKIIIKTEYKFNETRLCQIGHRYLHNMYKNKDYLEKVLVIGKLQNKIFYNICVGRYFKIK